MNLISPSSPNWDILFRRAERVTDYYTQVKPHLNAMFQIMERKKGVGLAAPQVGIPLRFFIYRRSIAETRRVVVNPEITWRSVDLRPASEGCLSFPGRQANVERPESVRVEYYNPYTDQQICRLLGGFEARVFQHEFDHLEGTTIFPRGDEPKKVVVPAVGTSPENQVRRRSGMSLAAAAVALGAISLAGR